jgi:hypothetical protein
VLRRGADIGLRIPIWLLRETLDVGCCSVAERIGTWKSASHREPNSNEAPLSRLDSLGLSQLRCATVVDMCENQARVKREGSHDFWSEPGNARHGVP